LKPHTKLKIICSNKGLTKKWGESEIVVLQIDTNTLVGIGKCKLFSNLISIRARVTNNIASEGVRG
jgi:hypothetical protein